MQPVETKAARVSRQGHRENSLARSARIIERPADESRMGRSIRKSPDANSMGGGGACGKIWLMMLMPWQGGQPHECGILNR
jgi:hypothetical protein